MGNTEIKNRIETSRMHRLSKLNLVGLKYIMKSKKTHTEING